MTHLTLVPPDDLGWVWTTNTAAAASIAYTEARNTLRRTVTHALHNGMPLAHLATATGMDEDFLTALIAEGDL